MTVEDVSASVSSDIQSAQAISRDMESFIATDIVIFTHVMMVDVSAHVPFSIHPSPLTSGDMLSSTLTDTACATHEAEDDFSAVGMQTK